LSVAEAVEVEATVVELMPSGGVRVRLASQAIVLAHPAGAAKVNFVRLRPDDVVLVQVSPHDETRGRIVRLLKKG
jgi:translation initiation factor IF-1